jgi:hypothetical protein
MPGGAVGTNMSGWVGGGGCCSSEGVIVHDILCIVCMQNQERFASADLFDPTDASAAGFYSLNKRNTW